MRTLLTIFSVVFMMGCQTTTSTSEAPTTLKQEAQVEPKQAPIPEDQAVDIVVTSKPVLCGEAKGVLEGIVKHSGEEPIGFWDDIKDGHKILLMHHPIKKTITVLEYPNPGVACMISVGVNAKIKGMPSASDARGQSIKLKY